MNLFPRITTIFSLTISLLISAHISLSFAQHPQKPFDDQELKTFCNELPTILNSLKGEEKQQYLVEVINDFTNTVFQREPERKFAATLEPMRFNYILNHIILAGIIKDMGGFGKEKITFLQNQKKKVYRDRKLTADEKQHIISELEQALTEVTKLYKQTQKIPKSELILLWSRKEQLNKLLLNAVPIRPKKMTAH